MSLVMMLLIRKGKKMMKLTKVIMIHRESPSGWRWWAEEGAPAWYFWW